MTTPCTVQESKHRKAHAEKKAETNAEISVDSTIDKDYRIERRADSQTWLLRDGEATPVHIRPCFPWSAPTRQLSLRDHEENECQLIPDIAGLDEESRKVVEIALAESGFILEIERIIEMIDEFEIRNWHVLTKQGERNFQTKRDDWPREIPGGGVIFRDVSGDLFLVRDPEALDEKSLTIIEAFVD